MNIDFYVEHPLCHQSCLVNVKMSSPYHDDNFDINLKENNNKISIKTQIKYYHWFDLKIDLGCRNKLIEYYPLEIKKIVFDNFYCLPRLTYSGEKITIEENGNNFTYHNINDENSLRYVGILRYQFQWPFFRMITL